jgi:DNA modification methylase
MSQDHAKVSAALDERLNRLRSVHPPSPKRPTGSATTEAWYSYYAGYADGFVKEIVEALPPDTGRVLDPWNGAGTTTSVATAQRLHSVGVDLNPAAVLIARARLLRSDVGSSVSPLTEEVIASARRASPGRSVDLRPPDDALHGWFDPPTAARLRAIERSIYRLLVSTDDERRLVEAEALDRVSSLAALFYLGLFRTIRPLVSGFIGSNPTWIKRTVDPSQRLSIPSTAIAARYRDAMGALLHAVSEAKHTYEHANRTSVRMGSSTDIGLDDDSVDAVITSPPYCTRIDYVIATLPELSALGVRTEEVAKLRASMIGTPVVKGSHTERKPATPRVRAFLRDVALHDSHAAKTYYWKFYRSYFDGMERSFAELSRIVRPGSPMVLVVQDSYFKHLRVPIPEILTEMGERLGWATLQAHEYPVLTNRAGMHRHARAYRTTTRATETVLIFRSS